MNKIGKRILAAAVASSVLVTPVFADPSVDDLKKSKESAQNEVSSLQTQLVFRLVDSWCINKYNLTFIRCQNRLDTVTCCLRFV